MDNMEKWRQNNALPVVYPEPACQIHGRLGMI